MREERSLSLHTTTAAVAEVYTVLRRRRGYRFAMEWADSFRVSRVVAIEQSSRDQDDRAWDVLHRLAGVPLSYVDGSLIALAARLRVDTVFTFDQDFRDAGLKVVPGLVAIASPLARRHYSGATVASRSSAVSDVLFEKRPDGVAVLTMNRPESLNAMGGELVPLIGRYLEECESDRAVRCVVLTGNGRGFCAGGDVKGMQRRNTPREDGAPREVNFVTQLERSVAELRESQDTTTLKLHTMGKPTIALVNGVAVGAGFSLALACDVRIASSQARFGTAFRNVGLSGDFGGSYLLPRLIGSGKARELYLTAEIVGADRALELGIVNRVVPHELLLEEGLAFAASIAAGPTATYARMKDNWNLAETSTLAEVLDREALNMRLSGLSRDSREAVAAFVEKREPKFVGE